MIGETEVLIPNQSETGRTKSQKAKARKRFRRRAAIEAVFSHLKHDFRLARNYLKGHLGDHINLTLAACAWNLKKWMRAVLFCLIRAFKIINHSIQRICPEDSTI
jgi:IS5 family transposase